MSIQFFEHSEGRASVRLPFVEDYAENNPDDDNLYLVETIKRTRKRTGYMVNTAKFSIFLFEDSKICQHIVEALAAWTKTGNGFELYAIPKDKQLFEKNNKSKIPDISAYLLYEFLCHYRSRGRTSLST